MLEANQDGVAAFAGQAWLHAEVEDDVAHHAVHARAGTEHALHRAPSILQLVFLPVVQPLRLGLEPGVDLVLGAEALIDVPRLVDEIQHDPVLDAFAELVGVDVASEDLQARRPVFVSNGVPVKPMNTAFGIMAFITRCSLPLCVRWHSSTKTNTSPTVGLGCASSSLMKASKSSTSLRPNLCTSEQSIRGVAWPSWVIRSWPLLVRLNGYAGLGEDTLDLFVQRVAVGDDGDAGVGVVLQNPLREQHHDDAFAAPPACAR